MAVKGVNWPFVRVNICWGFFIKFLSELRIVITINLTVLLAQKTYIFFTEIIGQIHSTMITYLLSENHKTKLTLTQLKQKSNKTK